MNYSPILSIFTAVFEVSAGIWALVSKGRKWVLRASAAILFLLAAYQIIETVLCNDPEGLRVFGRIAFMVVLWLPPTGLLLLSLLAGRKVKWLRVFTIVYYFLAALILVWLLIDRTPIGISVCLVVFAQYHDVMASNLNLVYGSFYQLGLISMLFISAYLVIKTEDTVQRKLIGQILFGCMAFIIPALIVVNVFTIASGSFSSILCHFALFLAIFIVRLIYLERQQAKS